MSNKIIDNPAVSYLKNLGIRKKNNLRNLLTDVYGEEGASRLKSAFDTIEMKREKDSSDLTERYDFIHSDPDFSRLMTCFEDGDYLKEMCRWLNANRERFGKTILDVGCGCGILSCFLALILPESTILAVDRSGNAIAMAKSLRDQMELKNIVFMQLGADAVSGRTFDTVFALRTVSENKKYSIDPLASFGSNLENCSLGIRPFMQTLGRLVSPGGNLILAEPVAGQLPALAIQNELNRLELYPENKDLTEFSCKIGDDPEFVRFLLCVGTQGHTASSQEILQQWETSSLVKTKDGTYLGIGASYMFWQLSDSPLQEYRVHRMSTDLRVARFGTYTLKGHPELFLLYQADAQNASLGIFPVSRLEESRVFMSELKTRYQAEGYLVL